METYATLFGNEIALGSETECLASDPHFLRLNRLNSLCLIRPTAPLREVTIRSILDSLGAPATDGLQLDDVLSIYLYTTGNFSRRRQVDADLDNVHGFSILTGNETELRHAYFELYDGHFRAIPELTMPLSGPIREQDLLLMHFAGVRRTTLPPISSIVIFVHAAEKRPHEPERRPDAALRNRILSDPARNLGASLLGLKEREIYTALLDDEPIPSGCGVIRGCRTGFGSDCVIDPSSPINYCSHLPAPPSCYATTVAAGVRLGILTMRTSINFRLMRDFRDDFLQHYYIGREYIGYYYIVSSRIKYNDRSLMDHIGETLPRVYDAAKQLLSPRTPDDGAVFNDDLVDMLQRLVSRLGDSDDQLLRLISTVAMRDMEEVRGLRKAELIEWLSTSREIQLSPYPDEA